MEKRTYSKRNHFTFGLGTIGRDMVYTLVSSYLIFYLTDVIALGKDLLWWIAAIMLGARVFDALNDPIMGVVVDNTRTRFGKFKPWIAVGAFLSGILTILLFMPKTATGYQYVAGFALVYLLWGIAFTINDISYWSMLPSLTFNQKEREKLGAFARICANIGLFFVVAGIVPITHWIEGQTGSLPQAYFIFAIGIVGVMWVGQLITLFGVKQPQNVFNEQSSTSVKELFHIILKNDQLLYVVISMSLFMIGYVTTTGFGLYFFKYAYGNENMYSMFAIILGISQLFALAVFQFFSNNMTREKLYKMGTILVVLGYILFFISPMDMRIIGIAGVMLFFGQAFIQLLMLMFLADSIEYGHWKLGKRNESVTFSLQPLINKMGGAIGGSIVSVVIILSGIAEAKTPDDVTQGGLWLMKIGMFIIPLIFILMGYVVYHFKYKIDKATYDQIIKELKERGEIKRDS